MKTNKRRWLTALLVVMAIIMAACSDDDDGGDAAPADDDATPEVTEAPADEPELSAGRQSEWYDEAEYDLQLAARTVTPEGPDGELWNQAINPTMLDTSEYVVDGGGVVCFSNVDVGNPWRVVGFTNMEQEILAQGDRISEFIIRDAGSSQEQQIADIEELVGSGDCDLLVVSPASTAALTPAVEAACESLPVIVFDRGVETDCPLTFIKPIGGYAFGADAADFLVENVPAGGNVLALRILPGVDVLETRYVSAQIILEEAGINILAAEFTEGDPATVKSIIQDLIDRGEQIDGVYMDAGANAVAATEAFEENGLDVPPINGEDQQDFLQKWSDEGLTALAPTYPTYQWRTAVIAAAKVLAGEEIPGGDWLLPQPVSNFARTAGGNGGNL